MGGLRGVSVLRIYRVVNGADGDLCEVVDICRACDCMVWKVGDGCWSMNSLTRGFGSQG